MISNFYTTAAQVLPVILLALLWESRYLHSLRHQPRRLRREDPEDGVLFWTKARARVYAMIVTTVTLACLTACMLVLAGLIPDGIGLRVVIVIGISLDSVTLLYRIWNEVREATSEAPATPSAPQVEADDESDPPKTSLP
jgi:hypothetical protein